MVKHHLQIAMVMLIEPFAHSGTDPIFCLLDQSMVRLCMHIYINSTA